MNLVAEGLTRDVVERAGGQIDERTLATLRAHMDSLGLVVELVRDKRQLTTFFIREPSGCTHRFVQIHPFARGRLD